MPELPGGQDELGIRWEGQVLQGKVGVREAFLRQAAGLPIEPNPYRDPPRNSIVRPKLW